MRLNKKKLLMIALTVSIMLFATGAALYGEEYADPGLPAALEKAQKFNEWMQGKTDQQIADELGIGVWYVLSPYGTEAPPAPLITAKEEDSWESLISQLLDKYYTTEDHVGIGYYNSFTGEEHFINADKYLVSASMFKIPLNMIVADRVSSGEMAMDTDIFGAPYSWYQYRSIVQSDNERSVALFNYLGGYAEFKKLQIPYLGNDPEAELGWKYQTDNFYTSRQFIHMLKLLYENPERFPGVIENMLDAEPFSYFHQYERRYPIAQKYGFVQQTEGTVDHTYINTCGIIYSDTPFCLVIFTDNVGDAYDLISELCMVMCDYTNLSSAKERIRLQAQQEADEKAALIAAEEIRDTISAEKNSIQLAQPVAREPITGNSENAVRFEMSPISTILLVIIAAVMVLACVLIFRHNGAGRINGFWAVVAILLAGTGLCFCVVGMSLGTLYAEPAGDPQGTVASFFKSIQEGNYPEAYQCLSNYSSLGLENQPASEEGRMLYDALRASYEYTLRGECEKNKLTAKQNVALRYLSVPSVMEAVERKVDIVLAEVVESRTRNQLFDEEGNYLQSVKDEVYRRALSDVLSSSELYYTSKDLQITLEYSDGIWQMTAEHDLISALAGGTL